jgi:dephospho-CoA kinase
MLVGLTGGISSGKSAVATFFATLNISVIKADDIVHSLIQPHSATYQTIVNFLGTDILTDSLEINKNKLKKIIFTNKQIRQWLEELLHPQVYKTMEIQIKSLHSPYIILEIPLLIEKPPPFVIDRILVIDCPRAQQIIRTVKRDNIPVEVVKQIIAAQIKQQARLEKSHDIIINDDSLETLKQEVNKLHNKYMAMVIK